MTVMPWSVSNGTFSETTGWSPPGFFEGLGGLRGGYFDNRNRVSGSYAVGVKKTTGSLQGLRQFDLWLFHQGGSKASGYHVAVLAEASGKVQYILRKWTGASEPTIIFESAKELTFSENDSFFLAYVDGMVEIYHQAGAGTPELIGQVEDSTYSEGYIGFGGNGSNPKLINLACGTLVLPPEVVRKWTNSPASQIVAALGQVPLASPVTVAALIKYEKDGSILVIENEAGETLEGQLFGINVGTLILLGKEAGVKPPKEGWVLVAGTKAAGEAKVRLHMYVFSTRKWEHKEGSENVVGNLKGNKARLGGKLNAVGPFGGSMAAVGVWNSVLTDAQVEALVEAGSLENWRTAGGSKPVALWLFNQPLVSVAVKDIIGSSNEISHTETTVVTESPPIPYKTKLIKVLSSGGVQELRRWIFGAEGMIRA